MPAASKRAKPLGPSEGGAKKNSLDGSWLLEKDQSDSLTPYLALLGVSDMGQEAWKKAEKETDTIKARPPSPSSPPFSYVSSSPLLLFSNCCPRTFRQIIKYIEEVGEPVGVRIHKRDRVQDEAQA